MNKKSFFERLTGSINLENETEENKEGPAFSFDTGAADSSPQFQAQTIASKEDKKKWLESEEEGQLTIDMHQTPKEIIIQTIVAGVKPDDLDVSISRDMVTIKGKRQRAHSASTDDYFYQELYWGAFSRSVILPQEIDVDAAEAALKTGVLTLTLPKLDKTRIQKIKVKND